MPKYLIQGSYSDQGLKGLLEEGGSKRREAADNPSKHWVGDSKPSTMPLGSTTL
jgi:hypothetical protein